MFGDAATLAQPFPVARGEVYVGGSVGIALTGGDSVTATGMAPPDTTGAARWAAGGATPPPAGFLGSTRL